MPVASTPVHPLAVNHPEGDRGHQDGGPRAPHPAQPRQHEAAEEQLLPDRREAADHEDRQEEAGRAGRGEGPRDPVEVGVRGPRPTRIAIDSSAWLSARMPTIIAARSGARTPGSGASAGARAAGGPPRATRSR